jgi:hypothetical protein
MIGEIEVHRWIDHRAAENFFEEAEFYAERTGGGSMTSRRRAIVVMVLAMGLMAGCGTGSVSKEERAV